MWVLYFTLCDTHSQYQEWFYICINTHINMDSSLHHGGPLLATLNTTLSQTDKKTLEPIS